MWTNLCNLFNYREPPHILNCRPYSRGIGLQVNLLTITAPASMPHLQLHVSICQCIVILNLQWPSFCIALHSRPVTASTLTRG